VRSTTNREWTQAEHDLAERIVDAVAAAPPGSVVGALSVARGAGLSVARDARARSLAKVYDVMPLAAIIAPERSQRALVVRPDHTYVLTVERLPITEDVIGRVHKMHTIGTRARALAAPLVGNKDLLSLVIIQQLNGLVAQLDPEVWNQIEALYRTEKGSGETTSE